MHVVVLGDNHVLLTSTLVHFLIHQGRASQKHLEELAEIVNGMLQYQPFELVTIHDEFKAHANNMNWVRWQYKEILALLAKSNLLDDLLSQIHGVPGTFPKLSNNLGELIQNSNYALC